MLEKYKKEVQSILVGLLVALLMFIMLHIAYMIQEGVGWK